MKVDSAHALELQRKAKLIQVKANFLANEIFTGEYASAFRGSGMEFDSVREYQVEDDIRAIDWNVTARLGKPYVKAFREEREITVVLLVDVSASNLFGSKRAQKKDVAAEVAAVLAYAAIKNNDKIGAILFSDRVEMYMPPKKGKGYIYRLVSEIINLNPAGRGTDIKGALEFFLKMEKKRVVAFLISDFICQDFERPILTAAKRHDMTALKISDPAEHTMPSAGIMRLLDPETGRTVLVDTASDSFRREVQLSAARRRKGLIGMFNSGKIGLVELTPDKDTVMQLIGYFKQRERRH